MGNFRSKQKNPVIVEKKQMTVNVHPQVSEMSKKVAEIMFRDLLIKSDIKLVTEPILNIQVKINGQTVLPITIVKSDANVAEIKKEIAKRKKILESSFKLQCDGEILSDNEKLDESTANLEVFYKPKGIDGTCLICRDEIKSSRVILPCFHEFCFKCFNKYKKKQIFFAKCPTCSHEFRLSSVSTQKAADDKFDIDSDSSSFCASDSDSDFGY